jgi:hypothetical protein
VLSRFQTGKLKVQVQQFYKDTGTGVGTIPSTALVNPPLRFAIPDLQFLTVGSTSRGGALACVLCVT